MSETPSDEQISTAVHEILRTHDLQTITLRMVMNMLCETFSLPKEHLTPQKVFVRSIINNFLETSYAPPADTTAPQPDPDPEPPQPPAPPVGHKRSAPDPPAQHPSAPAKPSRARAAHPATNGAASKPPAPPKPVKLTGLERPVVLAQPLADFFGEVVIPRSAIPGRISAYAKEHRLQDPADGRRINCDAPLKEALGVDTFTFFSLAKIVAGLVYKPDECDQELQDLAKACEQKTLAEKIKRIADNGGVMPKGKVGRPPKKQKVAAGGAASDKPRKPSGLLKPMQLSEALIAVVGEPQLPRSEVLKKIWVYIRAKGLKDPNDGSRILCDEKLRAVFDGSETVTNMGINKFLSAHMSKIEEG